MLEKAEQDISTQSRWTTCYIRSRDRYTWLVL